MFSIISVILYSSSSAFFGQPSDSPIRESSLWIRLKAFSQMLKSGDLAAIARSGRSHLHLLKGVRDFDGPRVCLDFRACCPAEKEKKRANLT